MRHKPNRQNNMSSFYLKQQFTGLLSNELKTCAFAIVLGFESSFKERICTLKFVDDKQLELLININYVKKSVNTIGCSFTFKVYYCALFVAECIKLIERAKNSVPQSYFDGLVFLNAINVFKAERQVSIYSPLSHWYKKPKRSYCMRPIEISSAMNSLNKLRLFTQSGFNEKDKAEIKTFREFFLLYTSLPEIAYIHASVPVYAMVDALKSLAALITEKPEVVTEFPILTLAPFERIGELTTSSFFMLCIKSNNEFLIGVAIRIISFLRLPCDLKLDEGDYEKLADAIRRYINCSVAYICESPKSGRCFIADNLLAIKTSDKSINEFSALHGIGGIAGNIHSLM